MNRYGEGRGDYFTTGEEDESGNSYLDYHMDENIFIHRKDNDGATTEFLDTKAYRKALERSTQEFNPNGHNIEILAAAIEEERNERQEDMPLQGN